VNVLRSATERQDEWELLYPIPALGRLTAVRGSVLIADQMFLREQGHGDAYERALTERSLLTVTAAELIPLAAVHAHWHALDSLALPTSVIQQNGRELARRVHGEFLQTLVKLAGKLGFSPWTPLRNSQKVWGRLYQGSGVAVWRQGDAMARFDVLDMPLCKSRFFRTSCMAGIEASLGSFCNGVTIIEREAARTSSSMSVRVAWK
jgi:hypothetical protein